MKIKAGIESEERYNERGLLHGALWGGGGGGTLELWLCQMCVLLSCAWVTKPPLSGEPALYLHPQEKSLILHGSLSWGDEKREEKGSRCERHTNMWVQLALMRLRPLGSLQATQRRAGLLAEREPTHTLTLTRRHYCVNTLKACLVCTVTLLAAPKYDPGEYGISLLAAHSGSWRLPI